VSDSNGTNELVFNRGVRGNIGYLANGYWRTQQVLILLLGPHRSELAKVFAFSSGGEQLGLEHSKIRFGISELFLVCRGLQSRTRTKRRLVL